MATGSPDNEKGTGKDNVKLLLVPITKSVTLFSSKTIVCSEISEDGKLQYDIEISGVEGGVICANEAAKPIKKKTKQTLSNCGYIFMCCLETEKSPIILNLFSKLDLI